MHGRNCPNCGAALELDKIKCDYCGTLYLDLGCLDLAENTPVFIKYKIPYDKESNSLSYFGKNYAYITQCAIPKLGTIEVSCDTTDCVDWYGNTVHRYYNRTNATTNLKFEAIPFGENKKLFEITIEE